MDFKQIEAFVNVIKYQGFSRAADASFLTQPTISSHIRNLETELGLKLIDRGGKIPRLTGQGQVFYQYALEMLNTREEAVLSLQGFSEKIDGIVKIQASSVPGQYIVPRCIAGFREKYPLARFYVEQSDSRQAEENLTERRGELGFTGRKGGGRLHYEALMEDEMVLITPGSEKFANLWGKPAEVKDFIDEVFVWREQGSATRGEFEEGLAALGVDTSRLQVVFRSNSLEAIKQAVAEGVGVSIISKTAASGEGFLTFPIKDFESKRKFYLVHDPDLALSPTAEMFRQFVLGVYGKEG